MKGRPRADGTPAQPSVSVVLVDGSTVWVQPRQLEALAMALVHGGQAGAAEMGIGYQTMKNHLHALYRSLDAYSAPDAAFRLGWLRIPEELARP